MSGDRLDGAQAEGFISACFAVSRDAVLSPVHYDVAVRSLDAAFSERPLLDAPTLVLDLAALLAGERLAPISTLHLEPIRDAVRAYEDHVLARLTADRRWTRLQEAVIAAPKELRPVAVGVVAAHLFQRLGLPGATGVSQFVLRRFLGRPGPAVLETGRAALYEPQIGARLADGLNLLAKAARRTRELLSDAEVFLVENIAALKGLGARVALSQLAEVAQSIEERLPARLRGAVFEDGDAPTALEEDSAYPVGGFSSISTVGNLENLVTSELIYMDDDGAPRPDLFDIRFVEGELLYYARDESVAVRRKRALVLVFDSSLARTRALDPNEKFQRLVWLLGAVAALVRKLSSWLDHEALRFELVFQHSANEHLLSEEEQVISLVLREFRERGQLDVRVAETSIGAIREARSTHGGRARVILFTAKIPSGLEGQSEPDAIVDAARAAPVVHWSDGVAGRAEAARTSSDAWNDVTRELLDGILRRQRKPTVAIR